MLVRLRIPVLLLAVGATCSVAAEARAEGGGVASESSVQPEASPAPRVTLRTKSYGLEECLALAERNYPNLWAARARLAQVHAQLEEASSAPWFQWSAQAGFGVAPPINGTAIYSQSTPQQRNVTSLLTLQPIFMFGVNGTVPVYTFGKITSIKEAAEAGVRVSEWDMEKARQAMRMDIRRAYFGLQFARDAEYVMKDALERLDRQVSEMSAKIDRGEAGPTEIDKLRLMSYREELASHAGEPAKAQAFALAGLRFLTGVQYGFDIPDEPLKRPDRPLVNVVQYLQAARLFRPEVNMARAGVEARRSMLDFHRAKFFPDIGIGLGADYATAPGSVPQTSAFIGDGLNHFSYYIGLGAKWALDVLPNEARVRQASSQLEEARAVERMALGGIAVEVENAYGGAVEAKGREEAWDRAEHIAKQWISTVSNNMDLGTSDEKALLDALKAWGNARVSHLQALMDLNVTMSQLALASGWDSAAPTAQ